MKHSKLKKLLLFLAVCMITSLLCLPLAVTKVEGAELSLNDRDFSNKLTAESKQSRNDNGEMTTADDGTITLSGTWLIKLVKTDRYIVDVPVVIDGDVTIEGDALFVRAVADATTTHPTDAMFTVKKGATLTITGSTALELNKAVYNADSNPNPEIRGVILNGREDATKAPAIRCAGTLNLTNVTIQKFNNTHTANASSGGAIATGTSDSDVSITLNSCAIYQCESANLGSAILLKGNTGTVSIRKTIFVGNATGSGGGAIRTFESTNMDVELDQCVFRGNTTTGSSGAAILWSSQVATASLTISDCQFINNVSAQNGGAIYSYGPNLTITGTAGTMTEAQSGIKVAPTSIVGSRFEGNTATNSSCAGGAIALSTDNATNINISVSISGNVLFKNNKARHGGGVSVSIPSTETNTFSLTIDGVTFDGNQATANEGEPSGGGIRLIDATTTIKNCTARNGAGIYIKGTSLALTNNVTISNCSATLTIDEKTVGRGGGIYLDSSYLEIAGATFTSNSAAVAGGGVFAVNNSSVNFSDGTFTNNYSESGGGAIYIYTNSSLTMSGGTITSTSSSWDATNGGGIRVSDVSTFTMTGGTISNLQASAGGGGVYVSGKSSFSMQGGKISNCTANENGGAVYVFGPNEADDSTNVNEADTTSFAMTGGTISGSRANLGSGGGIYVNGGAKCTLSGGIISKNIATKSGGGVSVRYGFFVMYAGTITENKVNGTSTAYCGGGGIGVFGDRTDQIMNVYIHGGTISNNYSALNGGGIAAQVTATGTKIYVHVGCSSCCGEKSGQTLTCANVGTASHTCPVITGNTAKLDGGGFYLHAASTLTGSGATLSLYCGSSDGNTASNTSSRNAYQTGGSISLYGFDFGSANNPGITLIGGDFTKYEDAGENWSAITPVTVKYWLVWEGTEVSYETTVSPGVTLNTPPYTNTDGKVTVSWHVGTPESTTYIYVGDAYTVSDSVNLYAVYKSDGHGTEKPATFEVGSDYSFAPTETTVSIAANSTFTVQFVITEMHPEYYKDRFLSFENQTDVSILPKKGTTIVMVVHLYNGVSTVREYYYYTFTSDYSTPIELTEFKKMGASIAYAYPQDIEAETDTEYTESYTFIVNFNNAVNADAVGNITLHRYANEQFKGGGSGNEGDVASQTAMFTLCANRSFGGSPSGYTEVDDSFTLTYTTQASGASDSSYNGKYASLVLSGAFPKDTVLTVGSNTYTLTSDGKFIVPLGQLTAEDAVNTAYTLLLSSKNSNAITVTAEVWVSDSEGKPFGGEKVTSEEFTLQAETLPALKISMSQRVFDLTALPANQTISVTTDATNGHTVVWSVQKKDGNGNYVDTNLVSVANGKLVWNSPTAGTYRIVATVKSGETVVLTVPFNFIILE